MILTYLKGKAVLLSLLAVFCVGAFVSMAVMKLRMDALESKHRAVVAQMTANHQGAVSELRAAHQKAADAQRIQADADQTHITTKYQGALNDARLREAALLRSVAVARAQSDGLRQQARTAARLINLPETAPASIAQFATASAELLADCSAAYTGLAAEADGHVSTIRVMQDAWPTLAPQEAAP